MINDVYGVSIDGAIYQKDKKSVKYDEDYVKRTGSNSNNINDEKSYRMSYLRLGNVIGGIGRVPSSILDVGYGLGHFLEVCTTIIPKCYGNDIGTDVIPEGCTRVDSIFGAHYDVITFFDSIEHFEDIDFVKELDCNYVCISVPNCHYFDDEWFANWKHRKYGEHLWHFNENSLTKFMNRMGYSLVSYSNVEDVIRQNFKEETNILTGIFKKEK